MTRPVSAPNVSRFYASPPAPSSGRHQKTRRAAQFVKDPVARPTGRHPPGPAPVEALADRLNHRGMGQRRLAVPDGGRDHADLDQTLLEQSRVLLGRVPGERVLVDLDPAGSSCRPGFVDRTCFPCASANGRSIQQAAAPCDVTVDLAAGQPDSDSI